VPSSPALASFLPTGIHFERPTEQPMPHERRDDPAFQSKGMPANYGRFPMQHAYTYQGIFGTYSRTYLASDEALRDSFENARFMRNDLGIMECLEARQRASALLNWHLEPEDSKSAKQKQLADAMTAIIERIPMFGEYRRDALEALWYGRYGIQHSYSWQTIHGKRRHCIARQGDNYGWRPINGDKLVWRYQSDPRQGHREGQMGIRVGTHYTAGDLIDGRWKVEPTERGLAYFLEPWERQYVLVHRHMIEDGEYEDPRSAGRIHGVGIRSRIYWEWFQKQETLGFLMEYLERASGGVTIWEYPEGNQEALDKIKEAAAERRMGGNIFFPKPIGDDAHAYSVQVVEPGMAGIDTLNSLLQEYFGHRIKRYILGQVLTSEAQATGLGSGVAEAHKDTFLQIVKYDATNLEETITEELVKVLQDQNFPEANGVRLRFVLETEEDDVEAKLNALRSAWEMGLKIKETDVYEAIDASVPSEDDAVLHNQSAGQDPMAMSGMGNPFGGMPGGEEPEGQANEEEEQREGPEQYVKWEESAHPRDSDGKFAVSESSDQGWQDRLNEFASSAAGNRKQRIDDVARYMVDTLSDEQLRAIYDKKVNMGGIINEAVHKAIKTKGGSLLHEHNSRQFKASIFEDRRANERWEKIQSQKEEAKKLLTDAGYKVERDKGGSMYFVRGNDRVRVSDHYVPETTERLHNVEHGGFSWAGRGVVLPVDDLESELQPYLENDEYPDDEDKERYQRAKAQWASNYARRKKDDEGQGKFRWITLNAGSGDDGDGGQPVLIDDKGTIQGGRGVAIAKHLEDHGKQQEAINVVDRKERQTGKAVPDSHVEEIARMLKVTPTGSAGGGGLFGEELEESLIAERADLMAFLRREMSSEARTFKDAASSRRRGKLESTGTNRIDTEGNRERAKAAEVALWDFDKRSNAAGDLLAEVISDATTEYANARTGREKQRIKRRLAAEVSEILGPETDARGQAEDQRRFSRPHGPRRYSTGGRRGLTRLIRQALKGGV